MYFHRILVARMFLKVFLKNRALHIIKFSCFFIMQRTVRGPRADITCLRSSRDYVSRSSILAVFQTMSSPGISPFRKNYFRLCFICIWNICCMKTKRISSVKSKDIQQHFFRKETQDYLFWWLKTSSSKKEQIRYIGQNLAWCTEHM